MLVTLKKAKTTMEDPEWHGTILASAREIYDDMHKIGDIIDPATGKSVEDPIITKLRIASGSAKKRMEQHEKVLRQEREERAAREAKEEEEAVKKAKEQEEAAKEDRFSAADLQAAGNERIHATPSPF